MASLNKERVHINKEKADKLFFKYLPAFASFLLENFLDDFVKEGLKSSREEEIPLLKFFEAFPEEELLEMGRKSSAELLNAFISNRAAEHIQKSTTIYIKNQLILLDREQLVAEDITLVSFIRRKAMRKFLTLYTTDFILFNLVMEDIDRFIAASETSAFKAYIEIKQEKINRTNEQLFEAQQIANLGSFYWDLKDKNSTYSPQLYKILESDDFTGNSLESFYEYVHPADQGKLKEAIEKAFKGDGIYECEYRFVKNNKQKVIWSRGLVSFAEGVPVSMSGTAMDVTDKHHMVRMLQRGEENYKQAQETSHIGNWTLDLNQNSLEWSDELYRIHGMQPGDEISYTDIFNFAHKEDKAMVEAEMQKSISNLQPFDFYYRVVLKNGDVKFLHSKGEVRPDSKGKPFKVLGIIQDVTEQKLKEKELIDKQNFIQKITNVTPSIIAAYNVNTGKYIFINQALKEQLGYDPAEGFEGGTAFFADIIHPDDLQRILEQNTKALGEVNEQGKSDGQHEKIEEFTFRMRHKKGNYKWFDVYGTVFDRDKNNKVEHVLNISIDVTEKYLLQEKLSQNNIELERMNKELESFNYVASHDLQEPLRKIQTFTNRILEKGNGMLSFTNLEYFNKIIESSSRMQLLIENLLTFSQTNVSEHSFEHIDLNTILEETKNLLSHFIEEKEAIIESTPLPVLRVVPFQFQQLLLNLIGNAIKYSHENTAPHIKISYELVKGEKISVPAAVPEKNYFELKVEDNGIGFEEENAEKIFGLFQRLHSKEKYSGTGIGLAICKKIAHNHNGFIVAKSIYSKGSTFFVYIPY